MLSTKPLHHINFRMPAQKVKLNSGAIVLFVNTADKFRGRGIAARELGIKPEALVLYHRIDNGTYYMIPKK